MLLLLLAASCNGRGWVPVLTLGLQAVRRNNSGQKEREATETDVRMRATARLGWSLDGSPPLVSGASARDNARSQRPVMLDNPRPYRCGSRALCAWEHRQVSVQARDKAAALQE